MAIGQRPYQSNRTPAPKQDLKTGGESYGQANDVDTPAVLPPSVGGPQTILGKNLRDSVNDLAFEKVLSVGTAGRDDKIPADDAASSRSFNAKDLPADGSLQRRTVSAASYAPSMGAKRQQNPDAVFSKGNSLPAKLGATLDDSAARRNMALKQTS